MPLSMVGVAVKLLLLVGGRLIYAQSFDQAGVDLALHQPTIQSSLFLPPLYYAPSLAVDGIFYNNWAATPGSFLCSNTASEFQPWWAVDLGVETTVDYVIINTRGDCCTEQSSNFTVGLTNVSPWKTAPTLPTTPCAYYPGTLGLNTNTTIYCDPNAATGRYLFIKKMDTNELTFCEVEVFGSVAVGPNLALDKDTIESSENSSSSYAVDGQYGSTSGVNDTCAQTNLQDQAWWAVDLGAVTTVTYVVINTGSNSDYTANFMIGLTNVSPWTTQPPMLDEGPPCAYQDGPLELGTNTTFYCDPDSSPGQYLFIKRSDQNILSICQVAVYSAKVTPWCNDIVSCVSQSKVPATTAAPAHKKPKKTQKEEETPSRMTDAS